jgi:hypothetical protein
MSPHSGLLPFRHPEELLIHFPFHLKLNLENVLALTIGIWGGKIFTSLVDQKNKLMARDQILFMLLKIFYVT